MKFLRIVSPVLLLALATVGSPIWAQASFVSTQFRVDDRAASLQRPPIALTDPAGGAAVLWEEELDGIFMRLVAADGSSVGDDIALVRSDRFRAPYRGITPVRSHPAAAFIDDDQLLLVWTESRQSITSVPFHETRTILQQDILTQRFTREGRALGVRARLNEPSSSHASDARLARLPDGTFLAAWRTEASVEGDEQGIYARVIRANGRPAGGVIRIDEGSESAPGAPALAVSESGTVLIVWSACCDAGDDFGVFGRVLDEELELQSSVLTLNATEARSQNRPVVAAGGPDFLVAWQSETEEFAGPYRQRRIRGQVVTADGTPVGAELTLSGGQGWAHDRPRFEAAEDGTLVLAWLSFFGDFPSAIFATRVDSGGTVLTQPTAVNQTKVLLTDPALAATGDGSHLVSWLGVIGRERAISARVIAFD